MSIQVHCTPRASSVPSAEELKACPLCGAAAIESERWSNVDLPTARISCAESCGAAVEVTDNRGSMDMKGAMAKARAAWNRRPVPEVDARFEHFATAAYDLSTWAACINWRGKGNQKEWLDELREKIETVQSLHRDLRGTMEKSAA